MAKEIRLNRKKADTISRSIQDEFEGDVDVSIYVKKKAPKQSNYVMFYQARATSPKGFRSVKSSMSSMSASNFRF